MFRYYLFLFPPVAWFKACCLDSHVGLLWLSLCYWLLDYTRSSSDDIFCSLVLLFNCLDWFLWSARQSPVTIPGLLKENVYPAASQITKALRRVPEIFTISAFIYMAFHQLQKGGLKLKLQFGWAHACSLENHLWVWSSPKCQSGLCFSLGYKTRPYLKKATNKTTGFPNVILFFFHFCHQLYFLYWFLNVLFDASQHRIVPLACCLVSLQWTLSLSSL